MITPELSVVIGWMFVGAALYFVYGLLRPSWLNSAGQLIGDFYFISLQNPQSFCLCSSGLFFSHANQLRWYRRQNARLTIQECNDAYPAKTSFG
jgi:hypothetical protein